MLSHLSVSRSASVHEVSRLSLSSGKSGMPYVGAGVLAYPNCYDTQGYASKVTVVEGSAQSGFSVRVVERDDRRQFTRELFSRTFDSAQGVIEHVFQDLSTGNHRLYSAESAARRDKDAILENPEKGTRGRVGRVSFHDGISAVLSALEWLTGEDMKSCFSPVSRNVGCSSNMPTLERVVFGQASRHVRVRRPSGSKSFSSGMATTPEGGAKLPSVTEQARRLRESAQRNFEKAETLLNANNLDRAEKRFNLASEYEDRAIKLQSVVNERMTLLRERAAVARAKRKIATEQAERDAAKTA
jgi:hypothetical protein